MIWVEVKLEYVLIDNLGRARCLNLMTEDPERQHRRAQLQKEREKFSKAQEWLDSVRDEDMEMEDVDQTDLADIKDDWSL
jgi:hypothetical protein